MLGVSGSDIQLAVRHGAVCSRESTGNFTEERGRGGHALGTVATTAVIRPVTRSSVPAAVMTAPSAPVLRQRAMAGAVNQKPVAVIVVVEDLPLDWTALWR